MPNRTARPRRRRRALAEVRAFASGRRAPTLSNSACAIVIRNPVPLTLEPRARVLGRKTRAEGRPSAETPGICAKTGGARLALAGPDNVREPGSVSLYAKLHKSIERPPVFIGGLPVEALSLEETADAFVDYCLSPEREQAQRPLYSTSVNGQVISLCARDRQVTELIGAADSINADGQPMVTLSRFLARAPLPERVATTDLFPEVAKRAARAGLTFYILGASERVNRSAVQEIGRLYPDLNIVGRRNGYFAREAEADICAEIAELAPDILWVSLGCPLEQEFVTRNLDRLGGVGIVKTAGGLLDFLSREKARAPSWMQRVGFEWLFRTWLEPRRLGWRYVTTNPHALYVMLTSMR
jgi:exopolysaccharide biosynthesis WecB/TagA/CpsF family protein